jgi:hypothetical protein
MFFLAFVRESLPRCASVRVQVHAITLASAQLNMPDLFELCVVAGTNMDYKFFGTWLAGPNPSATNCI